MLDLGSVEFEAHDELDSILDSMKIQDDRKQEGYEMEHGTSTDLCSRKAYYGGGTWWLDRWIRPSASAACESTLHDEPSRLLNKQTNWSIISVHMYSQVYRPG